MGIHKQARFGVTVLALVAMLFFVSACGSSSNGSSGNGSNGSNGSSTSIAPTQLLQKSTTAMKSLKSAHTALKSTSTVNAGTTGGTSTGTTGATGTPTTGGSMQQATVTVSGSGDEVFPNQASLNLTVSQGSSSSGTTLSEIVTNQKLYLKNSKGQWYVFTPSSASGSTSNPFASANVSNYNNLLTIAQKGKVTDDGYQTINGQKLRHLTVAFSQNNLQDLLSAMGQMPSNMSSSQQQQYNQLLSSIKVQQATLDLWINESNSYVYQEQFKLNLTSNGASGGTPTTSGGTSLNFNDNTSTTINYSKFNESVTITPPANAIPTNNLLTVLQ